MHGTETPASTLQQSKQKQAVRLTKFDQAFAIFSKYFIYCIAIPATILVNNGLGNLQMFQRLSRLNGWERKNSRVLFASYILLGVLKTIFDVSLAVKIVKIFNYALEKKKVDEVSEYLASSEKSNPGIYKEISFLIATFITLNISLFAQESMISHPLNYLGREFSV